MKTIFSIGFSFLFYMTAYCQQLPNEKRSKDSIVNLKYYSKIEMVINPGAPELFVAQDSTMLSYFANRVVMKIPIYETDFVVTKQTESGVELSDSGQPVTVRFRYITFRKGNSIGTLCDYKPANRKTRVNADSVWNRRISFPPQIITKKVDSLVAVTKSAGFATEYYIDKSRPDPSFPDSIILYYSEKLNGIPFSFSDELDKGHGIKLYKVQYIYKSYFDKTVNAAIPRREFVFEIGLAQNDELATKLLMTED